MPATSSIAAPTPIIVTIDGPAASGKSSVSREVARRFGWQWLSTGAFYRGLALTATRERVDLSNEKILSALASDPVWAVSMTEDQTRVHYRGEDVTDKVGLEETGSVASRISSFPLVRKALLEAQRRCAIGVAGLVAEGRDCGTVVFPSANVKIFLTARSEDRAARRAKEEGRSVDETHEAQQARDTQDATRKTAPMQASQGAHLLDTSALEFEEVVAVVEDLIRTALGAASGPPVSF